MTANVSEVYDPKDSSGAYPAFSHTGTVNPVIRGRKVIVPLHFWFTKENLKAPKKSALEPRFGVFRRCF